MRRTSEYAILSLGVALIISLVLQPSCVFAADMPMTPSTPTTPPTGSTPPTESQTAPNVITCPESFPACSFDKSITMTFTDNGIVFSSKPTVHGDPYQEDPRIHVTTLVQKGLEKNMQKYQEGIFSGYSRGFVDGMAGKDKESGKGEAMGPVRGDDDPLKSYKYGFFQDTMMGTLQGCLKGV
jgi:hypothetical protein